MGHNMMTLISFLISLNFNLNTGDGTGPLCTKMSCKVRFARLMGSGASLNVVSIASVLAVTLMIVTL